MCAGLDLVQAVESRHLSDPLSHEALDMSSEPHYLIPPRYVRYRAAKARHLWCMHLPQGAMGKVLLSILRVITLSLSCGTRYQWMLSEANGVRDMSLERFSTANTMKMSYRPSGSVIYPDSQRAASPPWRGISYRTERYPLSTPRRGARRKSTIPLCRITNLTSETCSPHKITSRHHIPKCHSE